MTSVLSVNAAMCVQSVRTYVGLLAVLQDAERQREEWEEKARLRHKHALAQIRLERVGLSAHT